MIIRRKKYFVNTWFDARPYPEQIACARAKSKLSIADAAKLARVAKTDWRMAEKGVAGRHLPVHSWERFLKMTGQLTPAWRRAFARYRWLNDEFPLVDSVNFFRKCLGLKIKEAAYRVGVHESTWGYWERKRPGYTMPYAAFLVLIGYPISLDYSKTHVVKFKPFDWNNYK